MSALGEGPDDLHGGAGSCDTAPVRFFNTEGPMRPEKHYRIPPLSRVDLEAVLSVIRQDRYFVLHAPRQTGKTSVLLALRDRLNAAGGTRAVYANVEPGQTAGEDVAEGMRAILGALARGARLAIGDDFVTGIWPEILRVYGPHGALVEVLSRWAAEDARPIVLFLDEVDALVGDTLVSLLRQLRAGYEMRPENFPASVALCGVRDVRDYRIRASSEKEVISGGSAFNVKAKSLRLGDFSRAEVFELLGQHTAETGQEFTPEALDRVWNRTRGQPWLVNALAREACFENGRLRKRASITPEDVRDAQEVLIRNRETHLDQLAERLREDRVRRVIAPLLSGGDRPEFSTRDLEYVRDLGLIAREAPLRIANPIYAEVVPRELTFAEQQGITQRTEWYVDADGRLDLDKLLTAFTDFFRQHSEHWLNRFQYQEAGPQLLLQAFLQRVVNAGGRIEREYGLGRGRTDLLIVWGRGTETRRHVIECKILRASPERTIREGVRQTARYMDRCGAESGHLVVFDRREGRSWKQRIHRRTKQAPDGTVVTVWGM